MPLFRCARDAARPESREVVLERLGLAQAGEWTGLNIGDQLIDSANFAFALVMDTVPTNRSFSDEVIIPAGGIL